MNTENVNTKADNLAALKMAIAEVAPDHRSLAAAHFKEAFPTLDKALKDKKPFKHVLELFNKAYGLAVSAPTFRKMLGQARAACQEMAS